MHVMGFFLLLITGFGREIRLFRELTSVAFTELKGLY